MSKLELMAVSMKKITLEFVVTTVTTLWELKISKSGKVLDFHLPSKQMNINTSLLS
jgi:hypothetical protein